MSWWDDGPDVLGDGPANQITAAWRRVLLPRDAAGLGSPTLHEALAAYAASLRAAAGLAPFGRLVLQRSSGPALSYTGHEPAPPDLRATFDRAIQEITRDYRNAFDRVPSPMELVKMLAFVVRPVPAEFFSDAAQALSGEWSLRAEPAGDSPA
jgi:hypothetical protein